jgi:hypothetical protein
MVPGYLILSEMSILFVWIFSFGYYYRYKLNIPKKTCYNAPDVEPEIFQVYNYFQVRVKIKPAAEVPSLLIS